MDPSHKSQVGIHVQERQESEISSFYTGNAGFIRWETDKI